MPADHDLGARRARRWWVRGRRIGSIERAALFVDDVGIALLFPTPRVLVPSLWEAVAGEDAEPFATGMDVSEQKVWGWKDELPRRGLAWYGTFVSGRGSFLSRSMLAALYPGAGDPDDHEQLPLSSTAHEIAEALASGPMPSAALRTLVGDRNHYQRAVTELQRQLLVTRAGVEEGPTGWPAALVDLTCRRFDVGNGNGNDFTAATAMYLETALEASAADFARVFRWPVADARQQLDALVDAGRATLDGKQYARLEH